MADSNTDTSTPAPDGTSSDHGSEFSKGTGTEDSKIWDKYFGKEAKAPKEKDSARTSSKSPRETSDGTSKSKASSGEKTPSSSTTSKSTTGSSEKSTKPKADKADASSSKQETKPTKDSTEPAGGKTAEDKDDAPADPEAPLKKARDLYGQAKKTEDRREARKLYKRAMVEAFGEIPEEFDDKRYAAVRTERAAAKASLDEQAKKNESRIQEAAGRLKPAIFVMRTLEGAGLGDKLTVPMVERAVHVMKALRSLDDGDYTQLAEVVARAAGVDHDEAMKRFVKGVKVSPEGKAARQAADQAQRDNHALKERLAQLERQLTEGQTAQTEAQKKQEHEKRVQEQHTVLLDDIQEQLDGHAVLTLENGAARVKAYLIRTADPKLKAFRYSYAQVADKIVAGERRRLQNTRHLLDDGEPARETPQRRNNGSVSRTETVDASVPSQDPMARFDYFFDKHKGEQRTAGGRRR